jgi:hypothetical protein
VRNAASLDEAADLVTARRMAERLLEGLIFVLAERLLEGLIFRCGT